MACGSHPPPLTPHDERHPFIASPANMIYPLVDVHLATRQAKATLAAKRHPFGFLAVFKPIGAIAGSRIATPEHLLHHLGNLRPEVVPIALPERLPVIAEDLLKGCFIDTCGWDLPNGYQYHGRAAESNPNIVLSGTPHSSPSQQPGGRRSRKKEILIRLNYFLQLPFYSSA